MKSRLATDLQYRFARAISPNGPTRGLTGAAYAGRSKLRTLLGEHLLEQVRGKRVIDFGCGDGAEAVELALAGAAFVVGVDIREDRLARARERAARAGVADRCQFTTSPATPAEMIVSLDSFEHFADPAAILRTMHEMVTDGGRVLISFGPTWYHPLGGHLFSIFPWAHVLLAEEALVRWRAHIRQDGATRFSEVDGGLNRMTIARFERLVAESPFALERLETVPIRRMRWLASRWTREWTTSIVRCVLQKPASPRPRVVS